jgi:hypothetical protein
MSLEDQIAKLDKDLRDLIVSWDRFFAGDLRVPPHADHGRLSNRLRALSGKPNQRRAEQFRLEQLQHRFASYAANWERMLREREEGRGRFGGSGTAVPPRPAAANAGGGSSVESTDGEPLYDQYVAAKREHGDEVSVDREKFERQLAEKRKKLQARLGRDVRFEVMVDDGKVKLAARKNRKAGRRE